MADVSTSTATGAGAGAGIGTAISPGVGTIVGTVIGGAIGMIGGIISSKMSADSAKSINESNLDFQKEQFNYQKYLNTHQFQMMSADAQKAGINPLAMTGGNVSSTSFSGSSAQPDYSSIAQSASSLGGSIISANTQRSIASQNNATAKEINSAQISAQSPIRDADVKLKDEELRHNKVMNKTAEQIQQQELDIIRRKNKSQQDYNTYDNQPLETHSRTLKIGPVSISTSDTEPKQISFIESQTFRDFITKNVPSNYTQASKSILDKGSVKNLVANGYVQFGHITSKGGDTYTVFGNRNSREFVIVSNR